MINYKKYEKTLLIMILSAYSFSLILLSIKTMFVSLFYDNTNLDNQNIDINKGIGNYILNYIYNASYFLLCTGPGAFVIRGIHHYNKKINS
jgi:hypothetical protein